MLLCNKDSNNSRKQLHLSVHPSVPSPLLAVPGSDVEGPVDLEDPLDVQRLLSQPRSVGASQEHRVSPHH